MSSTGRSVQWMFASPPGLTSGSGSSPGRSVPSALLPGKRGRARYFTPGPCSAVGSGVFHMFVHGRGRVVP